MTSLQDVVKAWRSIGEKEEEYRQTLRAALESGVPQVEISKALNRTREMLRRDAMTDEQREELRRLDAERRRVARARRNSKEPSDAE